MSWTKTPFGNLESMYGMLDYTGRVVLDIGADYGTTADYFLHRGAFKVLVSERNEEWRAALIEKADTDPRIVVLPVFSEHTATAMISGSFHPNCPEVVKVDCEGCEEHLGSVPDLYLARPESWVVETHTRELYDSLLERFQSVGYTVETVEEFPGQKPGRCIKVITAVRP